MGWAPSSSFTAERVLAAIVEVVPPIICGESDLQSLPEALGAVLDWVRDLLRIIDPSGDGLDDEPVTLHEAPDGVEVIVGVDSGLMIGVDGGHWDTEHAELSIPPESGGRFQFVIRRRTTEREN